MLTLLVLAVVVGMSLGLLGGGGSILTVPLLLYVAEMSPKESITSSLLVVGLTSIFGLLPHARSGHVKWRVGLVFGGAAMAGAFGGGWLAQFIPGWVLLMIFAGIMLATSVAMLRGQRKQAQQTKKALPIPFIALEGIVVGGITGMVGAGGGFLVVPALVILGGLPMREAIGTSLLVIAMKSLAGFAGYASHVSLDVTLTLEVSGAAILGAFLGAHLAKKLSTNILRSAFGWMVAIMGVFMIAQQMPSSVTDSAAFRAVFVDRWPWWIGGSAIAAVVLSFLYWENKLVGVSTGYTELCTLPRDRSVLKSWRPRFLLGILIGGAVAGALAQNTPSFALGSFDTMWSVGPIAKVGILLAAGALIGFGARTAGGCTSGHSIVGVALFSKSSLAATLAFMIAGFAATNVLVAIL